MKTERIYLRTSPEDKKLLQDIADTKYEGNLSALFDDMIAELRYKEVDEDGDS